MASSVAACPAAAKMPSVSRAFDTDVVPETAGGLLSTTGGADHTGVMVAAIVGIALAVVGKSNVVSNDTVLANDRV
jgi:hypothetical protein